MKLSLNWLREWVGVPADAAALAARITLAGLESEAGPMLPALPQGVVVGRILRAEPHPQADRLRVCEVDVGSGAPLQIVCGAANARVGLLAPCARPGARLPGGMEITAARLRGVESHGMLCSAQELGLADKSDGLLELDPDARPGTPIEQHLRLEDAILTLELTPNRGDCLSVLGLARETAALYELELKRPRVPETPVGGSRQLRISVEDPQTCSAYAGRLITGIRPQARTPDWMRERLRRSGIRGIHPVVDITNYVMLELGQPMHGFDAQRIQGEIRVRRAQPGEQIRLLNEQTLQLADGELLIADRDGPLALAGVMGGAESAVSAGTEDIFLESACFAPAAVAGAGRRHKLSSDSLHRFERGVDPALQRAALARATQLVLEICGGTAHPVCVAALPQAAELQIALRRPRIRQLLGHEIPAAVVEALLDRLGIALQPQGEGSWIARIPSWRGDLRIEQDLIEEIARLYGYDRIPARAYRAELAPSQPRETQRSLSRARALLVDRGWQEAVTLAFVDPQIQSQLDPQTAAIALDNPIAETLAVMRSQLWAGLIPVWRHNLQRQARRVRLFEAGVCFERRDGQIVETQRIGGLAAGPALPEQWGAAARPTDFYDIKADVEALLGPAGAQYRFEPAAHPALHPGQTARLSRDGRHAGWLGALHPAVVQALDLPEAPLLFELDWALIAEQGLPRPAPPAEFPHSRRDLAVVVAEAVPAQRILDVVRDAGGKLLNQVFVFDIYRGKGLKNGCKSVAIGLIFKDYSRTLEQQEVDESVAVVVAALAQHLEAAIRT